MFKLNLKIALRNLWKNKKYVMVNIFGLAAGLTGFVIILLYINFETRYDKWDPVLENVYQVGSRMVTNGAEEKEQAVKGFFPKLISSNFKEVEEVSNGFWGGKGPVRNYDYNGKKVELALTVSGTSKNFLQTYPLKALYGNLNDVYRIPNAYAISLSKAREIFGMDNPVNKMMSINDGNFHENFLIKAVWDDEKYPSYFNLDLIFNDSRAEEDPEYNDRYFNTMIRFKSGTDVTAVIPEIRRLYLQELAKRTLKNSSADLKLSEAQSLAILKQNEGITSQDLIIEPVSNLNLRSYFSESPKQKTIYILTALAAFLITISCVNFTNLAVVQATTRAKEVGVRKVLGAFRINLVKQFLVETAMQCLAAFFLSLVAAELMMPAFNELLETNMSLFASKDLIRLLLQLAAIVIAVVIVSGIYPAVVLSGFRPVKVLKGNFSTSVGVGKMRKSLMIAQFTISGALVICFLLMNAQVNFMKSKDLGMQTDQIVSINVRKFSNRSLNPEQFEKIKNRVMQIRGVKMLARATDGLIGEGIWKKQVSYRGAKSQVIARYVDLDYFTLINAKLANGRDFSRDWYATDTVNNLIINETAAKTLGLGVDAVGKSLDVDNFGKTNKQTIIGVIKDIQSEGFEKEIKPTVYLAGNFSKVWRSKILLKLEAQAIDRTVAEVKEMWKKIEPEQTPILSFESEKFAKLNAAYDRLAKIIFSFSAITLLISILGLFSLAAYNAKIRMREIAIRKVLGASTASILKLLNSDLVKLVIVANILGDLFAYIYMNQWFEGFVYRIAMPVTPFFVVNLSTIALAVLTVSWQSLKSVNANPVLALKYE